MKTDRFGLTYRFADQLLFLFLKRRSHITHDAFVNSYIRHGDCPTEVHSL